MFFFFFWSALLILICVRLAFFRATLKSRVRTCRGFEKVLERWLTNEAKWFLSVDYCMPLWSTPPLQRLKTHQKGLLSLSLRFLIKQLPSLAFRLPWRRDMSLTFEEYRRGRSLKVRPLDVVFSVTKTEHSQTKAGFFFFFG